MQNILTATILAAISLAGSSYLAAADLSPAKVQGTAVALTPQNSSVEFVCAHVGPKPDPRKGGFARLSGKAELDAAGQGLKALTVDIDTTSLWTEFDKLTTHLKSPDFFDVRKYPTAKFESTKIDNSSTETKITGKLTLHGVTKEISFPATVKVASGGLLLQSQFTIDRSEFAMDYDPKKVENKVALTIAVGK